MNGFEWVRVEAGWLRMARVSFSFSLEQLELWIPECQKVRRVQDCILWSDGITVYVAPGKNFSHLVP